MNLYGDWAYTDIDWEAVRNIYDLSKPDEMRGSVDLSAILPLSDDPKHLAMFRESSIIVIEEANNIIGFAGHKGNYISWVYVHPAHRRRGIATIAEQRPPTCLSTHQHTAPSSSGSCDRALA